MQMQMDLSIIIPCYNEELTIPHLLKQLDETLLSINYELIVIDDGSEIPLHTIIDKYIQRSNIHYFRFKQNMGKGTAIQLGIKKAKGKYVIIQDADLEYLPQDIPKLYNRAKKNKRPCAVYGTRFNNINNNYQIPFSLKKQKNEKGKNEENKYEKYVEKRKLRKNNKKIKYDEKPQDMTNLHTVGNKTLTYFTNLLYGTKLTDMETGYKLIPIEFFKKHKLIAREFEFEPEITSKLIINGYQIYEVPIHYKHRQKGKAKINMIDGLDAIFILFGVRFFSKSKIYWNFYNLFKSYLKKILEKILKILNIIHL